MRTIIVGLVSILITALSSGQAAAWSMPIAPAGGSSWGRVSEPQQRLGR